MYAGYGAAYQRPASPVFVGNDRPRSGSAFLVELQHYQSGYKRPAASQRNYQNGPTIPTIQARNRYSGREQNEAAFVPISTGFDQTFINQPTNIKAHRISTKHAVYDADEDFELIDFDESLSKYAMYERSAYAMFFSRGQYGTNGSQESPRILMTFGSSGGYCFPGGHIEPSDGTILDGLHRELKEEINLKNDHRLVQEDCIMTYILKDPPRVGHLYARELSKSDLAEVEKRAPNAVHWGVEVLGVVRVPLFVEQNGYLGFPAFLDNVFLSNHRALLIEGIRIRRLMHPKQLRQLVSASHRNVKRRTSTKGR